MWQNILDDARYFLRLSQRNATVSMTVVATMVLGIGVTTAVFSVVNGVILKPLPFANANRVDRVGSVLGNGVSSEWVPLADLLDYGNEAQTVSNVAIFSPRASTLAHGDFPKSISVVSANAAYPRVFDLQPELGRLFTADEFTSGGLNVVILTNQFWKREFGSDPSIVGQTVTLDDKPVRVVGVLRPTEFSYPSEQLDAIIPLYIADPVNKGMMGRGCGCIQGATLRRPGASVEQERTEVRSIYQRIAAQYPAEKGKTQVQIEPLRDAVVGPVRPLLILLSAAVATVLFIACVNIANLLLGQSHRRGREFAVRAAIGGSWRRLAQQLLTESMVMAGVGGLLGTLLAPRLARVLVVLYPGKLPRASEIGTDVRVLSVALLTTVAAGLLAGFPAARRALTLELVNDLGASGRGGLTRAQRRVGTALIAAQVALSIALLFAAGLFVETFLNMTRVDPGFDRERLLTLHVTASNTRYKSDLQVTQLYSQIADAVRTLPGVKRVGYTSHLPFGGGSYVDSFVREDHGDRGADNPQGTLAVVNAGYEQVMGIPLVRGRGFLPTDDVSAPRVAMINDVLAKRWYPGEDPVGQLIKWSGTELQIVGVLRSVLLRDLAAEPEPEFYLPEAQVPWRSRYMLVKVSGDEHTIIAPIQRVVRVFDPTIAVTSALPMADRVANSVAPQRFRAALVGTLGALALALAMIGIYGVVASSVTRQTKEIGIRMALGEAASHVQRGVVFSALRVTALGGSIGLAVALAVGKWSSSFLVGVSPYDPTLLTLVCIVVAAVAALAAYVPARRASRVDPLIALRME